jgi:hypothetical protein
MTHQQQQTSHHKYLRMLRLLVLLYAKAFHRAEQSRGDLITSDEDLNIIPPSLRKAVPSFQEV